MSTFRRRPWAPWGRSQREGNSEDLFKEQIIVKEKTWLWMSSLFESHQLSEMFFTSEKRPRVQGLQLKLVLSYTIAEAHTHSHRCKCTCSHTFLKTPNSFSSSLSTNLRNYSPIRMIKTPSTPAHAQSQNTHAHYVSSPECVCICVCVLASFPLSRRWGNDTDVVFWSHSAALQLHLRRLAELLLLCRCRRRGETSTARSVVSVSMWGGGRREGASERGWKQKKERERETVESRSTRQAVLCVASNKMDSENNESGRELLFNKQCLSCVWGCLCVRDIGTVREADRVQVSGMKPAWQRPSICSSRSSNQLPVLLDWRASRPMMANAQISCCEGSWRFLTAFVFESKLTVASAAADGVCVRARMHGCVSVGFVPVQMWVLDSLIAVSCINEYGWHSKSYLDVWTY